MGREVDAREGRGLSGELVATRWDAEYRAGRYDAEPALPFVDRILAALRAHPAALAGVGLYVGCGNGRNYLPLVDAGLDLHGLDVSRQALAQLVARRAALAPRLACAEFRALEVTSPFDYLVAIQVFQHGTEADAAAYFDKTATVLRAGGLFFLRVNSASTEVYLRHTVVDENGFGGFTIRYEEGPKTGLCVHFYAREELVELARERFRLVDGPREDVTARTLPKTGSWSQWEAVWQKR
ncbi:MAG TPA: methyltransferase [Methylomirabilota bacterium]|nr:methyltransferase [Methylomirabilota bacterium]